MNCTICNQPIVLVPSAAERARKFGGKASDYTKLFTTHSNCALNLRRDNTDILMKKTGLTSELLRLHSLSMTKENLDKKLEIAKELLELGVKEVIVDNNRFNVINLEMWVKPNEQ